MFSIPVMPKAATNGMLPPSREYLDWSDVIFSCGLCAQPGNRHGGSYPKRWEDREVPATAELMERTSEAYSSPEVPTCVSIPYRKPRTAHARLLQIYRHAC